MKASKGERIFYGINTIFLILVSLVCIAPMVYIFAVSLSSSAAVTAGKVLFWPVDFTLSGYEYLIQNQMFWKSMLNSVIRVRLGTVFNLICACLVAYPLSKPNERFKMRTIYAWIFFLPMIVNGGLIPTYMVVMDTGLIDSIWSLILPGAVPVFFIMVLLNFFRGIPAELEDAARIDGAGQIRVLVQIFLPLSKPALATLCVYAMLNHWNAWFDGTIYLNTLSKFPLLTYLQTVVVNYNPDLLSPAELEQMAKLSSRNLEAAQIFASSLPIVLTYPFFQKYFTKGLVLGGVKG